MHSLGKKIRNMRVNAGLTQSELSDKLNARFGTSINKSMISKWENDIDEPSLDNGRNLARYFNVSLDELLGLNIEVDTIAAHHDGEDWTEEELDEIERFKRFIKQKREY